MHECERGRRGKACVRNNGEGRCVRGIIERGGAYERLERKGECESVLSG